MKAELNVHKAELNVHKAQLNVYKTPTEGDAHHVI